MRRALALVLLALVASGCASPAERLRAGGAPAFASYYHAYHDDVGASYNHTYAFPVDVGAARINVTASLLTRSGGALPMGATPAVLKLALLDPSGASAGAVQLDAAHANATLLVQPRATGIWHLQISGQGASLDAKETQIRSAYELVLQTEA